MTDEKKTTGNGPKLNRRDAIKGLATVPVAGAFLVGATSKLGKEHAAREQAFARKETILDELGVTASPPPESGPMTGDPIRVGVIGFGIRGEQLARALGFATTDWIDQMRQGAEDNPNDTRLADFQAQEDLNV
ncbi:MAG: hypothetical protein P8X98_09855, partial [Woeseiaceae bacterium]